jgi:hypothetical protein
MPLNIDQFKLNKAVAELNADATTLRQYATAKTKGLADMQTVKWNVDATLGKFFAGECSGAIAEVSQETQRRSNFRTAGHQLPLDILAERDS